MFDVVSLALGPIQSGTVRALGVAAEERVAVLPDLPTLAEGLGVQRTMPGVGAEAVVDRR